jgi:hypothetical protein
MHAQYHCSFKVYSLENFWKAFSKFSMFISAACCYKSENHKCTTENNNWNSWVGKNKSYIVIDELKVEVRISDQITDGTIKFLFLSMEDSAVHSKFENWQIL